MLTRQELEFLNESNAIEGVYDEDSLQQAQYAWEYLLNENVLSNSVVTKTHKILMLHQPLFGYQRGYFREEQVWVGNREGKPWKEVPGLIEHWCMNVNDLINNRSTEKDSSEFLERVIREQHVSYEKIHPFVDGNGRTGRMFLNWTRVQIGLPILVIHEGLEQRQYYGWFNDVV